MFPKASTIRQSIRWASMRPAVKSDKIPVQLLQDCLPLGVTGQIVRVKPAYMRNFLHVGNKACYILEGQEPRIPVVQKQRVAPVVEKKVVVEAKPKKEKVVPALSLDDLSSLFSNTRSSASTTTQSTFTAQAASSTYSLGELSDSLPGTFTLNNPVFPISKEFLATAVFNSTGIEIPSTAIALKNKAGENVVEITTSGPYTWTFSVAGQTGTLQRNLNIQ